MISSVGAKRPDLDTILHRREQSGKSGFVQPHPGPGILREHFATVRDNEGLEELAAILLRRLDFASLQGSYRPAVVCLVFGNLRAKLVQFFPQIMQLV